MFKLALSSLAAAVAACVAAAAVAAGPVTHLAYEDDASFASGTLTALCGFPVVITIQGTVHITFRTDTGGTLHELDAFGDWSWTFSAPTNGTSTSFKFGPLHYVYPEGVYLGAPAILTATGIEDHVRGFPAEAGRTVAEGEIVSISPEGIPFVGLTGVVSSQTGNQLDSPTTRQNICTALAG